MGQALAAQGASYLNFTPTAFAITTAVSKVVTSGSSLPAAPFKLTQAKYLVVQTVFAWGSGGTTADVYVQTSLDEGATWFDIMNHHFTTAIATAISACTAFIAPATQAFAPGSGALSSGTIVQGVLGDRFRVIVTTTGTYAGNTSLTVTGFAKG